MELRWRDDLPNDADDEASGGSEEEACHYHTSVSTVMSQVMARSRRLIGDVQPRHDWSRYYVDEDDFKDAAWAVREYYQHNNGLISQYLEIDDLLDSSLPSVLLARYDRWAPPPKPVRRPVEEIPPFFGQHQHASRFIWLSPGPSDVESRARSPDEDTPLLDHLISFGSFEECSLEDWPHAGGTHEHVVRAAMRFNMLANLVLLLGKFAVVWLTSSVSVMASFVDAVLDMLSSIIILIATIAVARADAASYPAGNRQAESLGVLVLGVIMIVVFTGVGWESMGRLLGGDHTVVRLGWGSGGIMCGTILIKGMCWLAYRLVDDAGVQALTRDALVDVIFNTSSLLFPLAGAALDCWWLDPLGGLALSGLVAGLWLGWTAGHARRLSGCAAEPDARSVLLYAASRFAAAIRSVRACRAYHAGDLLRVELDLLLAPTTPLPDAHDLAESLALLLESLPNVDRAWVHLDYDPHAPPSHRPLGPVRRSASGGSGSSSGSRVSFW